MRMIVFFDLPMLTAQDRREYRRFRKFLITEGFIMMQKSVYSKISLNNTAASLVKNKIRKNKPLKGLVQMLIITEKQFSGIEYISGNRNQVVIDSMSRTLII